MTQVTTAPQLVDTLVALLGSERVSTEDADCVLYAQDVYTKSLPAAVVVRPDSTSSLSAAVKAATEAGYAVLPRGGGMSYTKGYVPVEQNSVLIDMSDMAEVLEVNLEDMYVRVQCGCSWQQLHAALSSTGFRTPYFGTLSGKYATVGGGLSQNAIFWGSGQHGFAVDSVVALEVVLADGSVIDTGAAGQNNSAGFMRHYGPDLTGMFCCDNATMGVKTTATLKLIPEARKSGYFSVCFETFAQQSAVMSEVAKQGLASECFGLDPYLQTQRMKRESLASDVKNLVGVMKSAGGVGKALKDAAKIALAGRNFTEENSWPIHYIVEDFTQQGVDQRLAEIKAIAEKHQGMVIENTIPKVLQANPFGPVNNMVGPGGERWVPIHALVPHSKALLAYEKTSEVFARHQAAIDKFDIGIGFLLATVANNVFVLEPVFFWPDELNELHHHAVEDAHLKRIGGYPASEEARNAVQSIREDLLVEYEQLGAIHMQIGKTYPYKQGIAGVNYDLVSQFKHAVDPQNRMNPGCLGFEDGGEE